MWKKLLSIMAALWSIVVPAFILLCNFLVLKAKTSCDFMVSFYVAGLMVLQGKAQQLYPPPDCRSWSDSAINSLAHATLPALPVELISNFMYPPLVAVLLAGWAAFPPAIAISCWQLLNVGMIFLASYLLSRAVARPGAVFAGFVLSMLFAPVFACLWVGQTSVAFGLLPLSAACFYVMSQRPLLAGLMLSFLALKPQFLIAALVACLFLPEARKTMLGFFGGLLGLTVLNVLVLSPQACLNWLHSLKLSEQFMGGSGYSMASYLAASLPAALLLVLPPAVRPSVHMPLYAAAAVAAFAALALIARLSGTRTLAGADAVGGGAAEGRLLRALFAALLAEFIATPRLVLYDLSLMLPALNLLCLAPLTPNMRLAGAIAIMALDLYTIICLTGWPNPLILVATAIAACIVPLVLLQRWHNEARLRESLEP